MPDIEDYSTTAASNTDDFPEGQAPSTVNNAGRETQADIAAWHQRITGTVTAGGTADALTATFSPAHTALAERLIRIVAASDNATTTPTLNLDTLGAKTIVKSGNEALVAGDIQAGAVLALWYSTANTNWELLNPATPPAGFVDSSHLASNSVTTAKIADGSVTGAKLDFSTSSGTNNISLAGLTAVGLSNIAWVTGHANIEIQVKMNNSGTGAGSSAWITVAALGATPQLVYSDDATLARLYNTDISTRYYNIVEMA